MIRALAIAAAILFTGLPAATAEPCTVDDATLTWGFTESFRSYISGTIANGEWSVADGATYDTPDFGWSGGAGTLAERAGTISFTGSIRFTGHGGILDTTVANPQLRFDGEGGATLLLDVTGTTQEGEPVEANAVEFATLGLTAENARQADGEYTISAAPAVLTSAGAAAFGTYGDGETLDPISASFPASRACAPVTEESTAVWIALAAVGAALLVAIVVALLLVRARRRRGNLIP